jgi:hypothetical protein
LKSQQENDGILAVFLLGDKMNLLKMSEASSVDRGSGEPGRFQIILNVLQGINCKRRIL